MASEDRPVTHTQAVAWLTGAAVALVSAALLFGNSVIGRAEAASGRVEDRIESRLRAIEAKVDRVLERLPPHDP